MQLSLVAAFTSSGNTWDSNVQVTPQVVHHAQQQVIQTAAAPAPNRLFSPDTGPSSILQNQPVSSSAAPGPYLCPISTAKGSQVLNWGGGAPTFFVTETTCRRKGTGFLADISNGLKKRKTYFRGAEDRTRPRLTYQEASQTVRRTLPHRAKMADSPTTILTVIPTQSKEVTSAKSQTRLLQPNDL